MHLYDVYVCLCMRVCVSVYSVCACISMFVRVCVQQQLKFASFRNGRPMSSETTGQDRRGGRMCACVCVCVCLWYACTSCTGEVLQHVIILYMYMFTLKCVNSCSFLCTSSNVYERCVFGRVLCV